MNRLMMLRRFGVAGPVRRFTVIRTVPNVSSVWTNQTRWMSGLEETPCERCGYTNRTNCVLCNGNVRNDIVQQNVAEVKHFDYKMPAHIGKHGSAKKFLPGDWMCSRCEGHNFARNSNCFQCGADKVEAIERKQGLKVGDWVCSGCSFHNYARRTNCKGCGKTRDTEKELVWRCPSCHSACSLTLSPQCPKCGREYDPETDNPIKHRYHNYF